MTARLTPVENRAGRWYKREDLYTGPGGVNGSKWRQCQFLVSRLAAQNSPGVVTAASVLSPQLAMVAIACEDAGLPVVEIVGATTPEKAGRHPSPGLAAAHGATIRSIGCAFNPNLQRAAKLFAEDTGYSVVNYGITTRADATVSEVAEFHNVGSPQVQNLPPGLSTLIVPFGSGNSATSILIGLAQHPHLMPRKIVLIGIGPSRYEWALGRVEAVLEFLGVEQPDFPLDYYDLHASGEVSYQQKVKFNSDGITLHPTYEGKVAEWLSRNGEVAPGWDERDNSACLWVIGSELKKVTE